MSGLLPLIDKKVALIGAYGQLGMSLVRRIHNGGAQLYLTVEDDHQREAMKKCIKDLKEVLYIVFIALLVL